MNMKGNIKKFMLFSLLLGLLFLFFTCETYDPYADSSSLGQTPGAQPCLSCKGSGRSENNEKCLSCLGTGIYEGYKQR